MLQQCNAYIPNSHHCRIVSSLNQIAGILGPGIPPGGTIRHREDNFETEISRVDASAAPSSGYTIEFVRNEAFFPASLFSSHGDDIDILLSSSLISQTAVFRGRNKTVYFTSNVFSISVIGEGNTVSDDPWPLVITFEKTVAIVSFGV